MWRSLISTCIIGVHLLIFNAVCKAQKGAPNLNHYIYSPTTQTLPAGAFALRASIRFGDIWGQNGGYDNFYGLDQLEDSYLGLHYGLSNRIQLGLSRTKGSGAQRQLLNGEFKLNILKQSDSTHRVPVSVAFSHVTTVALQFASNDPESLTYFEDVAHRFSYASQLMVSRKYSSFLELQGIAGYQHRNITPINEDNGLFYAGGAARISFYGPWDLLLEGLSPISDARTSELGYFPLFGAGLSYYRKCGDRWVLEITNGRGLTVNDFIPYSQSDAQAGEIRLGLTYNKVF
jgi:hypothetical protein